MALVQLIYLALTTSDILPYRLISLSLAGSHTLLPIAMHPLYNPWHCAVIFFPFLYNSACRPLILSSLASSGDNNLHGKTKCWFGIIVFLSQWIIVNDAHSLAIYKQFLLEFADQYNWLYFVFKLWLSLATYVRQLTPVLPSISACTSVWSSEELLLAITLKLQLLNAYDQCVHAGDIQYIAVCFTLKL